MKHTPGEWSIGSRTAAPDLLEICQELRFDLEKKWGCSDLVKMPHDSPYMKWLARWSDKLQAAIAKAT